MAVVTATQSGAAAAGQLGSAASGVEPRKLPPPGMEEPERYSSDAACGSKETMATSEREDELYMTGREHCCVALLLLCRPWSSLSLARS